MDHTPTEARLRLYSRGCAIVSPERQQRDISTECLAPTRFPSFEDSRPALYWITRRSCRTTSLRPTTAYRWRIRVEVRVPFVDHKLVESIFPLPQRVKIAFVAAKAFAASGAASSPSPPSISARPSVAFVGPTAAWLRNELSGVLADELSEDRQTSIGLFRYGCGAARFREHLTGDRIGTDSGGPYSAFPSGIGSISSKDPKPLQRLDDECSGSLQRQISLRSQRTNAPQSRYGGEARVLRAPAPSTPPSRHRRSKWSTSPQNQRLRTPTP